MEIIPQNSTIQPQLNLLPQQVICARHGELFRERWPTGFELFTKIALECLSSQPDILERVDKYVNEKEINITNRVEGIAAMLKNKPLCCQLPKRDLYEVLLEVMQKEKPWKHYRCSLCGHGGPGAVYRKTPPNAKNQAPAGYHRHVCLACVAGI